MSEPFVGEIMMFGGNFAIRGWAKCDGQLLAVSQNDALFSLLGTQYGGDGRTTFGLPDLRGRVPLHQGTGPGLTPKSMGQKAGAETVTLTPNQLPGPHTHIVNTDVAATEEDPTGGRYASTTDPAYASGNPVEMSSQAVSNRETPVQAHNNVQPFQCVCFLIALVGIYPSRN